MSLKLKTLNRIIPRALLRVGVTFLFLLPVSCAEKALPSKDWVGIIDQYVDHQTEVNVLELAELNLALAETGRLADEVFKYTQVGSEGIIPDWNRDVQPGKIACDVFYSMGLVAISQRMAFETNVAAEADYLPEMLLRLVQTNLINGSYPVAEKYIRVLENDGYDCSLYKPFLYNDAAVDRDPELGPRRRCIPTKDHIALENGIDEDLKDIIRANPSYHKAIEYLGVIYLLDTDMEKFRAMLDEFYGTEALPSLPVSFAEAACMLSELDRGYWKTVGVDPAVYKRYSEFKKRLGTGLSMEKHNDTFWYYIMRVNNQ